MESFRFSHYPLSTRRTGKRPLNKSPNTTPSTEQHHGDITHGNDDDDIGLPLMKRLKVHDDRIALPETTSERSDSLSRVVTQDDNQHHHHHVSAVLFGTTPGSRSKRGFEQAFDDRDKHQYHADDDQSSSSSSSLLAATTIPSLTTPSRKKMNTESTTTAAFSLFPAHNRQSAGQVTTETPEKGGCDNDDGLTKAGGSMNALLGKMHAERKQRNQAALWESMGAMNLKDNHHHQHAAASSSGGSGTLSNVTMPPPPPPPPPLSLSHQPTTTRRRPCVSLKTDSKLG